MIARNPSDGTVRGCVQPLTRGKRPFDICCYSFYHGFCVGALHFTFIVILRPAVVTSRSTSGPRTPPLPNTRICFFNFIRFHESLSGVRFQISSSWGSGSPRFILAYFTFSNSNFWRRRCSPSISFFFITSIYSNGYTAYCVQMSCCGRGVSKLVLSLSSWLVAIKKKVVPSRNFCPASPAAPPAVVSSFPEPPTKKNETTESETTESSIQWIDNCKAWAMINIYGRRNDFPS